MNYGVLNFLVRDCYNARGEGVSKLYGIRVIMPPASQTPRLNPPSFGGQSQKTGIFVRISSFKRRMRQLSERKSGNKNDESDYGSIDHIINEQKRAVRSMNKERFETMTNILMQKLDNPKLIKYQVERFCELKVKAVDVRGEMFWTWDTHYEVSDLIDDPKTANTIFPEQAEIYEVDDESDFYTGWEEFAELTKEQFMAQYQPSEKAKRQERAEKFSNMWQLVTVNTEDNLPDADNVVFMHETFPEPEWYADMMATEPEVAITQLDELYAENFKNGVEDSTFSSAQLIGGAEYIAAGKDIVVNCKCGRTKGGCHSQWIINKMLSLARGIASREMKAKGM